MTEEKSKVGREIIVALDNDYLKPTPSRKKRVLKQGLSVVKVDEP